MVLLLVSSSSYQAASGATRAIPDLRRGRSGLRTNRFPASTSSVPTISVASILRPSNNIDRISATTGNITEEGIAGLEHASGFIRRELGQALRLRKIPEFRFVADHTPEHASRIEELLRQAREGDSNRGD